jgi:hypothetical protein
MGLRALTIIQSKQSTYKKEHVDNEPMTLWGDGKGFGNKRFNNLWPS